jgi:hypothetical protein
MAQPRSRVRPKTKAQPKSEYDSPWKDVLEIYFEDFITFFFPFVHSEIDWTKEIEFLNKELKQVTKDAKVGRRYADTLAKVYRLNGEETWLYLHIEIQSRTENNFALRMFIYNTRISERYGRSVESFAVLADNNINWRPNRFVSPALWTKTEFEFPIVKLLDYRTRWSKLEADRNPFATVVMVHLRTLETTDDRVARKVYKLALIKRLYEQGFSREDIINLYNLIDWIMTLTKDLEREFQQELSKYEEEKKMPYITSIERAGQLKGQLKGELLEAQKLVKRQLKRRVGEIEKSLIKQVEALPVEALEELGEALLDFSTVANLEEWLKARPKQVEA